MTATHKNRVQMTVTSVANDGGAGLGALTLNAASSGYQSFATAYGANATVDILITEGSTWEVARECTYTHSGTTLSRGTTEASSSAGSKVAFTTPTVSVVLSAAKANSFEVTLKTYIVGLLVTKNTGGNTLDISAGSCYDPSSGKIIEYAGTTALSAGTLGASQWNQVYIYDSAGTATIQIVNNASAPSSTYAGSARQGGTNSNRRWIGCFYTNGSSDIVSCVTRETPSGYVAEFAMTRVLNGGTQTTYTAVSYATVCPSYVTASVLGQTLVTALTGGISITISVDGTNDLLAFGGPGFSAPAGFFGHPMFYMSVGYSSGVPQHYYKMSSANAGYIDIHGYEVLR